MQKYYITYRGKKYSVQGCARTGFTVYQMRQGHEIYIGRSYEVDSPLKAIIHIERSMYSAYY